MKINRNKTAFVLVGLAILLGVGIALAPQYLTKPATQMSFYVYSTQKDEGGFSLEMSPIFNLDGHLPRKMDFEFNVWTPDEWNEATIALAPMTVRKTTLDVEWVIDIPTARATSQDTKWNCLENSAGEIVMYKDKPASRFQLDCERIEPEVTSDEKWGRGNGTYEHPFDPTLMEGKYVKVMFFDKKESDKFARVKVSVDDKEIWVRVVIGLTWWTPSVQNGVTQYDYDNKLAEYWDDYTGEVVDNLEGIWHNDPNYDDEFVEILVPYKPTVKDQQIEDYWNQYENGLETMAYKGSWSFVNDPKDPTDKCYNMLKNFPLINAWGEKQYDVLFELCTGEKSEPTSIAHLWSVYGMGSGSWWSDDKNAIQVMTFFRQPPNSEILGTLTPCATSYPDLIRGLRISRVAPATDTFGTIFSNWDFDPTEGYYVTLGFEDSDHTDTMAVLSNTYFGYIPADQFILDEWDVTDNRPAQFGTIYLYKVTGCQ